jgi:uncharacterized protein YhbP (UPF0306 family)
MTRDQVIQFEEILDLPAMTIATVGRYAIPHAATVYFAADASLNFYFLSAEHSQHIQDLVINPMAAVTIFPVVSKWQEIRGVQMRGCVQEVMIGIKWAKGWAIFAYKFPDSKELEIEVSKNHLFVFTPTWIRLIDNRDKFGSKQEWQFEELNDLINCKEQ